MPTPREELSEAMRKARLEAGFETHKALARALNMQRPAISRAESPRTAIPSIALLTAWARACGVPVEVFTEIVERAKSGTPEWFMPYLSAEAKADTLRCWGGPAMPPGLCQTESYAYAALSVEPHTPGELAALVRTRMERQKVIERAHVTAIIDYHALQREIGSPAVMAEECANLVKLAGHPKVGLYVVPKSANLGTWGALDIATTGTLVTVSMGALQDVTSTAPEMIGTAMRAFDRILGAAMPRAESLEFCRALEEQWKQQI